MITKLTPVRRRLSRRVLRPIAVLALLCALATGFAAQARLTSGSHLALRPVPNPPCPGVPFDC
jgi:hypothetical protein